MKCQQMKLTSSEHLEQVKFIAWCRAYEFLHPCLKCIFAIPNAGKRNVTIGKRFKREGLLSGVSDIFVPYPVIDNDGNQYHGLWIEFKYGKNKLTKAQKEFQNVMYERGYVVSVAYSCDEAINILKKYLKI